MLNSAAVPSSRGSDSGAWLAGAEHADGDVAQGGHHTRRLRGGSLAAVLVEGGVADVAAPVRHGKREVPSDRSMTTDDPGEPCRVACSQPRLVIGVNGRGRLVRNRRVSTGLRWATNRGAPERRCSQNVERGPIADLRGLGKSQTVYQSSHKLAVLISKCVTARCSRPRTNAKRSTVEVDY